MKVLLNGTLVNLDDMDKIASVRYGIKGFTLYERTVFKCKCGKYVLINMIGNMWWNYTLKIRELTPNMISDLLEGQEIDQDTENILVKENIVEVVKCQ